MAYIPLTTQVAGGTASAAGWANLVKGNFESMGPHLIARKIADESLSSNTTLQDDDVLAHIGVGANEVWQYDLYVAYQSAAVDLKFSWSFPSGGVLYSTVNFFSAGGGWGQTTQLTVTDGATQVLATFPAPPRFGNIKALYINAGTAGDIHWRWAQNASSATATTVKAQSTWWGVKLA